MARSYDSVSRAIRITRTNEGMLWRTATALVLFFLAGPAPSPAQDSTASASSAMTTDRPAFTNSSLVVPLGSFQVENGFLVTHDLGQNVLDGPETVVRFGVARKTELRLTVPNYVYNLTLGGGAASGFGDLAIGAKQQLGPLRGGFDLSVTVFLSLPSGASGVSSGGYDPGLQLAWSRGLTSQWTAAGMFSLYAPTQGRTRNVTGESAFLVDRQLTKPWDAFLEYVGDFPERGGTRHLLHFGTSLKLAAHHQLDFRFGAGLSRAAVDHFLGIGYSFRFQALRR